jgi:hypothetical protein
MRDAARWGTRKIAYFGRRSNGELVPCWGVSAPGFGKVEYGAASELEGLSEALAGVVFSGAVFRHNDERPNPIQHHQP